MQQEQDVAQSKFPFRKSNRVTELTAFNTDYISIVTQMTKCIKWFPTNCFIE
jgi:hypothetical protein